MKTVRQSVALAVLLLISACGGEKAPAGETLSITVKNRTGYAITDLRMAPNDAEDWGENRLDTVLDDGEDAEQEFLVDEKSIDNGLCVFSAQLFGEDDSLIAEVKSIGLTDGGVLTVYFKGGEIGYSRA